MTAESAPAEPRSGVVRRIARAILWPLRRFFDPRFAGVHTAVMDVRRLLITDMEAANETTTLTGRTLDRLAAQNEALLARLGPTDQARDLGEEPFVLAYAFRALSAAPPRASVAAVTDASSSLSRVLEALGYDVTTELGLRTAHHEGQLDAVVWLTAEHDPERLRRLHHLTRDGGVLVLVAAVGSKPTKGERVVYDQRGLDALLGRWKPSDVLLVRRAGNLDTWTPVEGPIAELDPGADTRALVTATKRRA